MPDPLPLAAAAERLRRPGGRPRTRAERQPPVHVHVSSVVPLLPRLLDRDGAARFLSVSLDVIDQFAARGILRRVRLPGPLGSELRRVLYAVEDLDALVDRSKDEAGK